VWLVPWGSPDEKTVVFWKVTLKTRTKWQLLQKASYGITCVWCKVLKTHAFGQVLKVHLVPQGSPDEKTFAFWKLTFKNSYKMTTFDKNLTQDDTFLMQSLKNKCFWTSLEGASGSTGFLLRENKCFLKSDIRKRRQNNNFWQQPRTEWHVFDEES
jgi:hypothetical protein